MEIINTLLKKILVLLIQSYRYFISPLLSQNCLFDPSCSCYALQVVKEHGAFFGILLTIKRLLSCHPWYRGNAYTRVTKKSIINE